MGFASSTYERGYVGFCEWCPLLDGFRPMDAAKACREKAVFRPPAGAHPRDGALSRVATALAASPKNKAAAWDAATADDELRRELAAGRAFSGFDERAIRFAPTFRRKMGRAGIVQGSGAAALAAAYTLFKDEGSSKALAVEPVLDRARKCLSESQQRALDLTSDDYPSATPRFDAAAAAAAHAGLRHPARGPRLCVAGVARGHPAVAPRRDVPPRTAPRRRVPRGPRRRVPPRTATRCPPADRDAMSPRGPRRVPRADHSATPSVPRGPRRRGPADRDAFAHRPGRIAY